MALSIGAITPYSNQPIKPVKPVKRKPQEDNIFFAGATGKAKTADYYALKATGLNPEEMRKKYNAVATGGKLNLMA